MANPTLTSSYQKWRPSEGWNSPIVLYCSVPKIDITVKAQTNGADIGIGDFVEFIQVVGDSSDLQDATLGADNSTTIAAIVDDTELNRKQLAADNSVETYSGLTKSTARFADNSPIDVVLIVTGATLIVASKIIDSVGAAGYKAFTRVQCAGTNRVDVYATAQASLGYLLSQVYNVASLQWVAIAIQRGY